MLHNSNICRVYALTYGSLTIRPHTCFSSPVRGAPTRNAARGEGPEEVAWPRVTTITYGHCLPGVLGSADGRVPHDRPLWRERTGPCRPFTSGPIGRGSRTSCW